MRILPMLISSMVMSSPCFTQDSIPPARISEELESYYQHPSSSLLARIILNMESDPSFARKKYAQAPYLAFLVVAFGQYRSQFEPPSMVLARLSHSQELVLVALDLSRTKDTVLNWPVHSPTTNDMLWGGFFASGDIRYLERLVSEMRYCDSNLSDSYMIGGSAKWSLQSNARKYPEVRQYLQQALTTAPADLQPHIRDALKDQTTDSTSSFFHKDTSGAKLLPKRKNDPDFVAYDKNATIVKTVVPEYPEDALRAGLEGNVLVQILINEQGIVQKVELVKSDADIFNKPAIEAARQFVFTPAYFRHKPVASTISFPFRFRLQYKK